MDPETRDKVRKMLKDPYAGFGATEQQIQTVVEKLGVSLPENYLDFLRQTNDYIGDVGDDGFVSIWPIEEVLLINEANHFREWIPGLVLFASDGGGEFYAFDMRGQSAKVVMVPAIPLDLEYAVEVGSSFVDFLERLARPS